MAFIEKKPPFICIVMRERAKTFASIVKLFDIAFELQISISALYFSEVFWHKNEAFPKYISQNKSAPHLVVFHGLFN